MINIKFAIRNIKRSKNKSLLMIILSSVIVLFLIYYMLLLNSNNYKLDRVYDSTEVLVKAERKDGSSAKKEIPYIEMKQIEEKSGLIKKAYYTGEYECSLNKDGTWSRDDILFLVPTSDINREIVIKNFNSDIEYYSGYDSNIFNYTEKNICIVSRELLEKQNWQIGQTITLYAPNKNIIYENIAEFLLVGVYNINGNSNIAAYNTSYYKNAVYCAVNPFSVTAQTFYNTEASKSMQKFVLTETEFVLNDSRKAEEFKEYIKSNTGYYTASSAAYRTETLIIYDSDLKSIIGPIQSINNFMENALPIIYFIIAVIAFGISYLLTQNRITDIALMRAMGLKLIKIYGIIINEFIILSVISIVLGLMLYITMFKNLFPIIPDIFSIFAVCFIYLAIYLFGSTIALIIFLKLKPISVLTRRE